MAKRVRFLTLSVVTAASLTVALLPAAAQAAAADPTVSISSPLDGRVVSGQVPVAVSGTTDPMGTDTPAQLQLFLDGAAAPLQTFDCPVTATPTNCDNVFTWDTTALTGTHVLKAAIVTATAVTITSTPVSVNVSNPTTAVRILSPSSGDTVWGVVGVSIQGTTDAALNDYPSQIAFLVDGVVVQTLNCPQPLTDHTCIASFTWDSTGRPGAHKLSATLDTVNATQVNSSDVEVTVDAPAPRVAVTSPSDGLIVKGTIDVSVSGVTALSQSDYPEEVSFQVDGVEIKRYPCPTPSAFHTCSFNFSWDTTGKSGDHTITARMKTTRGLTATSPTTTVTTSNPLPTVSVTSPTDGTTVSGITTINVTGATHVSQSDYPSSLALYIDGLFFQTSPCPFPHTVHSCQSTFTWDSTGLPGPHTLTASVTTTRDLTITSADSIVNVDSPAPVATVTSPADGDPVSDVVKVSFSGSTAASQTDYPERLTLKVDGNTVTTFPCPLPHTVHACQGSLSWDTSGLTGTHALTASVLTTGGLVGTSAAVNVTVNNPAPTVAVLSPLGGTTVVGVTTVHVSGATDVSQNDYPVQLVLYVDGNSFQAYNCPLPQTVRSCAFDFTWDATGIGGTHVLSATVLTTRNTTGTSDPVTVTVNNPEPRAIIASPTAGSNVSGTLSVAVTGSTNSAQSDYPARLVLYIDGIAFQNYNCPMPQNVHSCGVSFTWDATGLSGSHILAVAITTTRSVIAVGPAVTVIVNSPAPVVAIKSPTNGGQVSGAVRISVTGATEATQSDKPSLVQLYVDNHFFQEFHCLGTAAAKKCSVAFQWDSSGKLGRHLLRARMYTAKHLIVVSKIVSITVTRVQAAVTLIAPAKAIVGKPVALHGCVTASSNGRAAPGIQVVVTVTPAFGKPLILKTVSDAKGCYSLSYKPVANATITARSVASAKFAASSTSTTQLVGVTVTCKVSSPKVQLGVKVVTTCTLPGLKPGLAVEMQFNQGGKWHNVLVVSTGGTTRTFTIALASAGTYIVRVVLPKNRYFMLSESKPFTFVVA